MEAGAVAALATAVALRTFFRRCWREAAAIMPPFLLRLGQPEQGVDGGDDQRRTALAPAGWRPRVIDRHQQILRFGRRDETDRHADDQRRAPFSSRIRRITSISAVGALPMPTMAPSSLFAGAPCASPARRARWCLGLGCLDHVGVGDVVVGGHAEVGGRGFERPTQIISTSATMGVPPFEHRHAGLHGVGDGRRSGR